MLEENGTDSEDEAASKLMSQMTIDENTRGTTLIWFDGIVDKTEDMERIRRNVGTINDDVLFPTGIDSCIEDIKTRTTKRILLAISNENVLKIPPDIINLPQLDSIFVSTGNRERLNQLHDHCSKVVDVCEDTNDLINSIEANISQSYKRPNLKPFHDQHQRGTRLLSEQSAELLW